ncbi:lantibiotic dehydratase [Myceligenerans halotolerans]
MTFTATGLPMIRLPLFPGHVPPPPASSVARGDVHAWLEEVWTGPFAAAVELASPDLAARVRHLLAQPQTLGDADTAKVARAVARYARRAQSRATPFGLFAGVAPVDFTEAASVAAGSDHVGVPRVDGVWLTDVVDRLERYPELLRRLPVRANELAVVRDGRLVLGHRPATVTRGGTREVSAALTGPVVIAMRAAREPVLFEQVTGELMQDFPDARAGVVETMLTTLVRQGFLTTSLRPNPSSTDPLGDLMAALEVAGARDLPSVAPLVGALDALATDTRPAPVQATSAGTWRAIAARQRALAPAERPVGVDVRADAYVTLPRHVAQQAGRAADLLTRLTSYPAGMPAWVDYHGRFLERYGPGAVVPLADLLGETGLGYPATYVGTRITLSRTGPLERERVLMRLAQHAALARSREVELDERLLQDLAVADPQSVQPHTELRFELHAPSRAAIDDGDFTLLVTSAARAAGTTTGRFWHLLTEPDRDRARAAMRALPTLEAGALRAQVAVGPLNLRTLNITGSGQVLDHVIHPDSPASDGGEQILLEDLAVTADVDRIGLVWLRHDEAVPVEPTTVTAIELTRAAHPLARFLCEISTGRSAPCDLLDWGAAVDLPFLPRLRHGTAILSPARWRLHADDLPAEPGDRWRQELARWREQYMLPTAVLLAEDDRRLRLDLDASTDQDLLHTHLARHGSARLVEAPDPDAFGWLDGRPHEIVVPLATQQPSTPPPPARLPASQRLHTGLAHLPGHGQWLSAHIYSGPDRLDAILVDHLPALLTHLPDGVSWWFLPYAHPEPHLRLRLATSKNLTLADGMEHLGTWTQLLRERGLASHAVLDTYRPETGRYGTGELLAAAHEFFAADSAAARLQRAATRHDRAARPALTAAAFTRIAAAMTASPAAGAHWLLANTPRTPDTPPDRDTRTHAIALADPDDGLAFTRLPGTGNLVSAWYRRDKAARAYRNALTNRDTDPAAWIPDLLHLHSVRMVGLRPDDEHRALHLARAAALAQTARARSHT